MLIKKLNEFRKDQSLIELFREDITDDTMICQIRALSEEFVQVTEYNHSGDFDGITLFPIDQISDILWDSREISSLLKLATPITPFEIPSLNLESLTTIIEDIHKKFGFVEIWKETHRSGAQYGEIVEFNDEWIQMHEFSPKSNMNRYYSLARCEQISKVSTNTKYLKQLKKLYIG